ncbi:MAG: AraC family transcriptional regulator [Clostridium sp.]|nr:AraC family transcriptional regulator [Clostridium sp.]
MIKILESVNWGENISEVISNDGCKVLKVKNETGEGVMTVYDVFPGVIVMYNDFHMSYCVSEFQAYDGNLLCIDYCTEGCMEHEMNEDSYCYLESGDLNVDIRRYHAGKVTFPLNHFHSISIVFFLPDAEEKMKEEIKDFSVDLHDLQEKFCRNKKGYVIKARDEIANIFSGLYHVPFKIRNDYFRIKIFELLLYLDALEFENEKKEKIYFYKDQVEKIKCIQRFLTNNMTKHYTIKDLSEQFDISQSALKKCFKTVYGRPIFSYMQNVRINIAADMIINHKEKSIAEIAGTIGYDSPSKFSSAFKKIIGTSPFEYRKCGEERIIL